MAAALPSGRGVHHKTGDSETVASKGRGGLTRIPKKYTAPMNRYPASENMYKPSDNVYRPSTNKNTASAALSNIQTMKKDKGFAVALGAFDSKGEATRHSATQVKGLSDGTNQHHGYINKIRKLSASGKPKEVKKVPLVRTHSKTQFKPTANHSTASTCTGKGSGRFQVPVPKGAIQADAGIDGKCETSVQLMIRNKMVQRPHNVADIDAVRNPLSASSYAMDIIHYLQAVERKFSFPANYLHEKHAEVTPNIRTVLMDWLIQVQNHHEMSQHALHLCGRVVDRFLLLQSIRLNSLQLLGITALLIAAKYFDRFPPDIEDLCHLTDGTYTPAQVLKMERIILKKIDYDLNLPGPVIFLDRFLQVNPCQQNTLIKYLSMYILDLMLTDENYVHFVPSLMAASAIYISRDLLGCVETWNESFVYYTKYSEQDLVACVRSLRKVLSKVSKSNMLGAKTKYAHAHYHGISHHRVVVSACELWPEGHDDDVFDSYETVV